MDVISKYKEDSLEMLKLMYPKNINRIEAVLDTLIEKKFKERNVNFANDYENFTSEQILSDICEFYWNEKPLVVGNGVFYHQHETPGKINISILLLDTFLNNRKVTKKEMFKAIEAGNKLEEDEYEMLQLTWKLFANSYYGGMGQASCQYFNKYSAPAVTYSGVQLTTTALLAFEYFFNNFKFSSLASVLTYIKNIKKEEYYDISKYLDKNVTRDSLKKYLLSKCNFTLNIESIDIIISNLSQDEINKLYYKNNFYEFINDSPVIRKLLSEIINIKFISIKDLDETKKEILTEITNTIVKVIHYNYQIFDRLKIATYDNRDSILVVDTDSCFIHIQPFFDFLKKNFRVNDNESWYATSTDSIITHILSVVIRNTLDNLLNSMHVQDKYKPIINMKSEFLYEKIITTRNKKNYLGRLIGREGHSINPAKIDMKGISIKKSNVNKTTREFFNKMIKEEILIDKDINLSKILAQFIEFGSNIKKSLQNGETAFLMPSKVSDPTSYKDPFKMMQIKALFTWNLLNPENEIQTPTTVNILKLKSLELNELELLISGFSEELLSIKENIYNNKDEQIQKMGLNVIALPRSLDIIPKWLIPLIDYDTIVEDSLRPGFILLESLGLKLYKSNNKELYTNILDL